MTEMLHQSCRHCRSTEMLKDYSSGDIVCTNCGIVCEERIRDQRPEWKDFNEDEDRAKGKANAGRCDLFDPHDGNYHCGKILPRNQTHQARSRGSSYAYSQDRLTRTSYQIQHIIAKQEAENNESNDTNNTNQPRHREQLNNEHHKWSLDRALKYDPLDETVIAPVKHRDAWLKIQSMHKLLQTAALTLQYLNTLKSNAIVRESALILCKYATRRDGFRVRGVTKNKKSNVQTRALCAAAFYVCGKKRGYTRTLSDICAVYNDVTLQSDATGSVDCVVLKPKTVARAIAELKLEFPEWIQSGGVSAPSSLSPIYRSVPMNNNNSNQNMHNRNPNASHHCEGDDVTMTEATPDLLLSSSSNASTISTSDDEIIATTTAANSQKVSKITTKKDTNEQVQMQMPMLTRGEIVANMTEYLVRKLRLPSRAVSAISAVVRKCVNQDMDEGSKPSTVISAATLLVCTAGHLVERLARQQFDAALEDGSASFGSIAFCHCTTFWAENGFKKRNGKMNKSKGHEGCITWKRTLTDIQCAFRNSQKTVLEFYNRVLFPHRAQYLELAHGSIVSDCVCGRCASEAVLGVKLAASMMREGVKCSESSMSIS